MNIAITSTANIVIITTTAAFLTFHDKIIDLSQQIFGNEPGASTGQTWQELLACR